LRNFTTSDHILSSRPQHSSAKSPRQHHAKKTPRRRHAKKNPRRRHAKKSPRPRVRARSSREPAQSSELAAAVAALEKVATKLLEQYLSSSRQL
jgi:hypothetical protein